MDAKYKDGSSLTDHEITGMLVAAMFAGHHTSSVTTAWTLLELLQHPSELAKVVAEVDEICGDIEGEVDFLTLRKLKHTEHAIKEALRLHPPLFILLRAAQQDFEAGGYKIKRGDLVRGLAARRGAHGRALPRAERFDPDRFAKPRREGKQPYGYIPFGAGRHKCMGNAFAILQIKAIFARLLREYRFDLVGDPIEADFQGLVIGPKMPCRVRYRRRQLGEG